jgi:heme-degrading monooxygenase HmoA
MYAVIFRARAEQPDQHYQAMVAQMRDLAFAEYGCRDFIAVTEGDCEIAISYWDDEEAIRRWKNDPRHSIAQQRGRDGWYSAYTVQVVEIRREYSFGGGA